MSEQSLWRNRDFVLLWSGQVVSTIGMRITALAYPLLMLAETGSPFAAGLVGFALTLPFLFYLPAGVLVDRLDRKRLMLAADAGRATALISVATAIALDRLTLPLVMAAAFVEGCLFITFQLSESAALPHVVKPVQLPAAMAQNEAREHGADLAGQPLGGVLFGVSHLLPFVVDAITYAISFGTLLMVRPKLQGPRQARASRPVAEAIEGVQWLLRQRFLRTLVVLIGATNLVSNALPLVLIVRAQELGASAALIGFLFAMPGVAAILGSIIAPRLQRTFAPPVVILGSLWIWVLQFAALPLLSVPIALGLAMAAGAFVGPAFNVVIGAYRYSLTPDHLQGRTLSAARLVAWGTIPLGTLSAGFMLEAFGSVTALLILTAGSLTIAMTSTSIRQIRRAGRIDLSRSLA